MAGNDQVAAIESNAMIVRKGSGKASHYSTTADDTRTPHPAPRTKTESVSLVASRCYRLFQFSSFILV